MSNVFISPSKMSLWIDCPRKWAYTRIDTERDRTETESARRGKRIHKMLEGWLEKGVMPPATKEGMMARSGMHHLPDVGTVQVEHKFQLPYDGAVYIGTIDAFRPSAHLSLVIDHKTTASINDYAMTTDEMVDDPQWLIYARYANSPFVAGRWVYYQTRGDWQSKAVHVFMAHDEISDRFNTLHKKYSLPMLSAKSKPPNEVPANPGDACVKYGGCPYAKVCDRK